MDKERLRITFVLVFLLLKISLKVWWQDVGCLWDRTRINYPLDDKEREKKRERDREIVKKGREKKEKWKMRY